MLITAHIVCKDAHINEIYDNINKEPYYPYRRDHNEKIRLKKQMTSSSPPLPVPFIQGEVRSHQLASALS